MWNRQARLCLFRVLAAGAAEELKRAGRHLRQRPVALLAMTTGEAEADDTHADKQERGGLGNADCSRVEPTVTPMRIGSEPL